MTHSLAHRYWATVENPRLAQIRPVIDIPDLPQDPRFTGRVLKPAGDETIPLADLGRDLGPAPVVAVDEEKILAALVAVSPKAISRQIARQPKRVAGAPPVCEGRDSLHDPVAIRSDEPAQALKPREPHKDVKARSVWKRRPGTFRLHSNARLIGGQLINR